MLPAGGVGSRIAIPAVSVAMDGLILCVSLLLAATLRQRLNLFQATSDVDQTLRDVGILMLLGWLLMMWLFGSYRAHQLSAGAEEYRNVVNSSVIAAGFVGISCYLFKYPLSRGFFVYTFAIGIPLLLLGRYTGRRVLNAARRRGWFRQRVLVAGDGLHIDEIATILERETWLGYRVVGALRAEGSADTEQTRRGFAYVGEATAAADAALRTGADTIIVAGGAFASSIELRRAQWALENDRVQVIVAPSVTDMAAERVRVRPMAGLPLVHLDRPRGARALRWAKRCFDVVGASVVLLLVSPVMLVAAVVVKLNSDGPVLFRQQRVGRDGQRFAMLKFRSMVVDAEALQEQMAAVNESDGMLFKIADDPRITRPGRWLRRYSIDELPQLINVLSGQMSLVGPRPALPAEVGRYDTDVSRRLRVRPGITGLWQVSGRSDLSWEDTVRLDLYYVDNWSMVQDVVILIRTAKAVLRSSGAY